VVLGLINWLKSVEGTVSTPSLQQGFVDLKSPVDGFEIDVVIVHCSEIPITKPIGSLDLPMCEASSVIPSQVRSLTTIVITILGVLHSVDVH